MELTFVQTGGTIDKDYPRCGDGYQATGWVQDTGRGR